MPGEFTFDDYVRLLRDAGRPGLLESYVRDTPGLADSLRDQGKDLADLRRQCARMRGIHSALTAAERLDADLLDARRRRRVAAGAGVAPVEVARFVKQFEMTRMMMRAAGGTR